MNATTDQVFIEALSLPVKARAALAHKLLISLEEDVSTLELEEEWDREALSRYEAFKKGKIKARSAADVMHDARTRLQ